jgi:hypothetical protein
MIIKDVTIFHSIFLKIQDSKNTWPTFCHSGYLDELYCGLHSELIYLYSTQDSGRYTVEGLPQNIKVTLCILMLQRAITQILLRQRCSLKCMLQLYDKFIISSHANHIGGVMISVLASSAVDRGFEHRLGQTKDKKKGICCFSAQQFFSYIMARTS